MHADLHRLIDIDWKNMVLTTDDCLIRTKKKTKNNTNIDDARTRERVSYIITANFCNANVCLCTA